MVLTPALIHLTMVLEKMRHPPRKLLLEVVCCMDVLCSQGAVPECSWV